MVLVHMYGKRLLPKIGGQWYPNIPAPLQHPEHPNVTVHLQPIQEQHGHFWSMATCYRNQGQRVDRLFHNRAEAEQPLVERGWQLQEARKYIQVNPVPAVQWAVTYDQDTGRGEAVRTRADTDRRAVQTSMAQLASSYCQYVDDLQQAINLACQKAQEIVPVPEHIKVFPVHIPPDVALDPDNQANGYSILENNNRDISCAADLIKAYLTYDPYDQAEADLEYRVEQAMDQPLENTEYFLQYCPWTEQPPEQHQLEWKPQGESSWKSTRLPKGRKFTPPKAKSHAAPKQWPSPAHKKAGSHVLASLIPPIRTMVRQMQPKERKEVLCTDGRN